MITAVNSKVTNVFIAVRSRMENSAMIPISVTVYYFLLMQLVYGHRHCPSEYCDCRGHDGGLLECRNVPDMEKMETITNTIAKEPDDFKKFYLKDTQLPALPKTMFRDSKLTYLDFENVELPFLVPPIGELSPFSGLKTLSQIHFKNVSFLYNWNWTMFSGLKALDMFSAEESLFVFISKTFADMKSPLKTLNLVKCKIKCIEDGAFASFKELSKLFLNDNEISSFSRSILPNPANRLTNINLSNNNLTSLADDLFNGMTTLSSVKLENNKLTMLPASIANVEKRFTLYIGGNPLNCDCGLLWICKSGKINEYIKPDYSQTCAKPANLLLSNICKKDSAVKKRCENAL